MDWSNYSVAYAIADSMLGPFKRIGKILQQTRPWRPARAIIPSSSCREADAYFIVYHRRPLGETSGNHRWCASIRWNLTSRVS